MDIRSMKQLRHQRGFSIIEIAAAILVFAVGMLALSYLQTSLTRSQSDSNNRAVATNYAEQIIEQARGFSAVDPNGDASAPAYGNITEQNLPTGAIPDTIFTITPNVVDYRWDGTGFTCYAGEFDNGNEPAGRCVAGGAPAGASAQTYVVGRRNPHCFFFFSFLLQT